ncbi:MAG: hypothetical protein KDC36_09985, partial [Thermoleophilia bacterium]|nr:hypothetical protein [Thermoleophilia bacterium]
ALAALTPIAAAQDQTKEPPIPATVSAKSPFKVDRTSSQPLGLAPDQVDDPFTYPGEPVVLSWSPVPGAVGYSVEISTNSGFTNVVWSVETEEWSAVPDTLFPDGTYWWRVRATDAAGTEGVYSSVAKFAKNWPSTVTGGVLSATPGGAATSLIRTTPYMRWSAVPGARTYDTEIAAANQFGTPAFWSTNFPVTAMSPAELGLLPDDGYEWRVRAQDPKKNPGPWITMGTFTKAWVAPEVIEPADGANTADLYFHWNPVSGAEKYQIQITEEQFNWQGVSLKVDASTNSNGFTPTLDEVRATGMGYGDLWWRVRPVTGNVTGTWSAARKLTWSAPSTTYAEPTLWSSGDSDTALTPHMRWTDATGENLYRIDIATDSQFNNIVESEHTLTNSWVPRVPLADNETGKGYYWRVVWGSGATIDNPHWLVSETTVPVGEYKKETRVTLGSAAQGEVKEPPVFTWGDVPGAPQYELQLSRDAEFNSDRTQSLKIWGTGTEWAKDKGKRLPSGTWFWRVRALDGAANGQTWSEPQTFSLNPPRPVVSAPREGEVVIGSPVLRWGTVNAACAYQVQLSQDPSFTGAVDASSFSSMQTAGVAPSTILTAPGRWYWRVRANFCDEDYGPWSPTRNFKSVTAPKFNLNRLPQRVSYGKRLVVAGRLIHNGAPVTNSRLLVERRLWPATDFTPYGTVRTSASGTFAFSLKQTRNATWRVRWVATDSHPEGVVPFTVSVRPRVSFAVRQRSVERRRRFVVRGFVYPKRKALIQVRESTGWRTVSRTNGKRVRFATALRATMTPGRRQVRLLVPRDSGRRLDAIASSGRKLFVYDKFVLRRR